jgi:hypothetical protein
MFETCSEKVTAEFLGTPTQLKQKTFGTSPEKSYRRKSWRSDPIKIEHVRNLFGNFYHRISWHPNP